MYFEGNVEICFVQEFDLVGGVYFGVFIVCYVVYEGQIGFFGFDQEFQQCFIVGYQFGCIDLWKLGCGCIVVLGEWWNFGWVGKFGFWMVLFQLGWVVLVFMKFIVLFEQDGFVV